MADEIASLKVVIETEDRASSVISDVAASMGSLGSANGAVIGQSAAFNAAMAGNARSGSAMGAAVNQTKNNLKQLENGLASSQKATRQYSTELRNSANTLKQKQAAVKEASAAYKANSAHLKNNISTAQSQKSATEGLIKSKKIEIDTLQKTNAHLNSESQAYLNNQQRITQLREDVGNLEKRKENFTKTIRDNESALARESNAYSTAQAAVSKSANAHEELKGKIAASKNEEKDYKDAISKTREELTKQEAQYEKLQKAEKAIDTGRAWKNAGENINAVAKPLYVVSAATAAAGAAVSFEDNFASVKKTVDGTDEQLAQIKQDIIDMTTVGIDGHSAIPLTTAELTELASAGGQLGIATENISSFTETMAMLGTATNLSGEQGAQTLARFMNVTNTSQDEISNLGSAIVDLGNNFATTEAEIADMALSMGATGSVVGISAQDVLAYSTALSSLGVDAAAGGSAVSRIWMDIQSAVSAGGEDLQKFAKLSGKSSKEFAAQWKNDASGAFRDFLKGLNQDKDQVSTLADLGFNNIRDIQALQRLAGEKGFDLLTEAIERSNTAWEENTALQTEFDAKAETTASKIQVAKNNAVEAARSFGEIMLPTIVDVTGAASAFTQKLAGMSDGGKKAVVTAGAVTVGLGALTKGAASTVKTVGGVIEGVGEIKKAMAAGGTLAKFAPTLTAIGSAAVPVALGIAGITAAVIAGNAAHDAWYNSNYKFADGLSDTAKEIKSYKDKCQELNDLQWEYKDLTFKINSEELSGEELEYAKSRLEDIKNILKEKYKIDLDTDDLDEAVEKIKELEKLDFLNKKKELRDDIENLAPKYEKASSGLPQMEKDYNNAEAAAKLYADTLTSVAEWQEEYDKGLIDADTYTQKFTEALNSLGKECGKGDKYGKKLLNEFSGAITGGLENPEFLSSWLQNQLSNFENELNIDGLKAKLDDAKKTIEEYEESVQTLAAIDLSELKNDFESGIINDTTSAAEINAIIEKLGILDNGLQKLHQNEKINVKFNLDTGGLDISDLNGTELGEVTAEGKINWKTGELPEIKDQDGKIIYYGDYSNLEAPTLRGTILYKPVITESESLYNKFYAGKSWAKPKAKGDMNFSGGLAKVNDDGKSDPRELIIDRGRAFIPEGRDVILPLSRGAKVYTSDQTKAIMRGIGIPHYADGKNNSDAFTSAKDYWTHYTKTHAVTTAQELEKWLELSKKFTSNQKDVWDIQEQIFSLQKKITKELNDQSKAYLEERSALNDWGDIGDSPLEAFGRIKDRNYQDLQDAKITWDEYVDNVSDAGKILYEGMLKQSDQWLDDQVKYYNMSADEYIAGINREQARLEEFYAADMMKYAEYVAYKRELNNKERDAVAEKNADEYAAWQKDADAWEEMRSTYGDWDKYGDSEEAFVKRKIQRVREFYEAGIIGFEEFIDDTNRYSMDLYKTQEGIYDDMLKKQSDYISDMQEQFSKQEQALRDSWEVADRKKDVADVSAQLEVYSWATTDRGQQKYAELQEQMKQLQRDEELYNLQLANNATIEQFQADYEQAEDMKADFLKGIAQTNIDISDIVGNMTANIENAGNGITSLLSQLLQKFDNLKVENTTNYNDMKSIVNNISHPSSEKLEEMINGYTGR